MSRRHDLTTERNVVNFCIPMNNGSPLTGLETRPTSIHIRFRTVIVGIGNLTSFATGQSPPILPSPIKDHPHNGVSSAGLTPHILSYTTKR